MVSRIWTVGLAVALAAWTTSCERHSWEQVSEFHRGHHGEHGDHGAAGHGDHGSKEGAHAEGKGSGHEADHAGPGAKPKETHGAEHPKPH